MSRLTHSEPGKQFKCLVVGNEPLCYVQSIPAGGMANNYPAAQEVVERQSLIASWSKYYYRSGGNDA
ncbi:hypothetical protein [Morganella psychrotolerans]|uniref:hypothetical protein n=1 Tax=Morganella psychrotolerans TaxID=368603 RepID=UPI0039B02BC1